MSENLLGFYSLLCGDLNGRKSKTEGIYIYLKLVHFAIQQKLTQHCKATISQFFKKSININ